MSKKDEFAPLNEASERFIERVMHDAGVPERDKRAGRQLARQTMRRRREER